MLVSIAIFRHMCMVMRGEVLVSVAILGTCVWL